MSAHEPRSGRITVNGVELAYHDWGGQGAPIVILHATGMVDRIYHPIANALTRVGRVFSYDQRGHGDTGRPSDSEYHWHKTMEDLAAFIAAMGLSGARGFGHSAGATAIGALASERPELISRAVLVEPVVFNDADAPEAEWRNPFVERTLKRRRAFDSVEAMYQNFVDKPPYHNWREDMLRAYCEYGSFGNAEGRRELKCPPEIEAKFYESSRYFDGLGAILRCERPLLIVFGENSDSLAVSIADQMAAGLKRGRVITYPGAGHFLPMEKPEEIIRLTIDFFAAA